MDIQRVGYNILKNYNFPLKNSLLAAINRYRNIKLDNARFPSILTFFVTNKCNLKCKHCFYSAELNIKRKKELNLKEISRIADSIDNLRSMSLTGGETFLRKDIPEIISIFHKKSGLKYADITSNGFLSDFVKKEAQRIARIKGVESTFFISLDGIEKLHDKIRGIKGSFKNAVKSINYLKKIKGIKVVASTAIHIGNYKQMPKLIDFVENNLGVEHRCQYVRSSWRDVRNIDPKVLADFNPGKEYMKVIPLEDIKKLDNYLNKHTRDKSQMLKREYFIKHLYCKKKMLQCKAGKLDGVIYASGDVAFCEMTVPFANLKDYNFNMLKLWNSSAANKMRKKINKCFCTHSCNLLRSMPYDKKSLIRLLKA